LVLNEVWTDIQNVHGTGCVYTRHSSGRRCRLTLDIGKFIKQPAGYRTSPVESLTARTAAPIVGESD